MGQGQRQEASPGALGALAGALVLAALLAPPARAQVDPLTAVGRAVTVAMDARTKAEVQADVEIAAGANKRLLEDKKAQWKGVAVLTFAQHVVLAGEVKTEEARRRVEEVVRADRRIRSLKNELRVGDSGSFVRDSALQLEINAVLTATKGVSSVNLRWNATGGRVVLMGVARTKEEADLAVSKVRAIKGVKAVRRHLRIVPLPPQKEPPK